MHFAKGIGQVVGRGPKKEEEASGRKTGPDAQGPPRGPNKGCPAR
jgi:hypothetical protein